MKIVIGTRQLDTAFRYTMILNQLGFEALATDTKDSLLACLHDPESVLLLLDDGFIERNTSAHALIDQIRSIPGPKSSIPIIRVWNGLVLASPGRNWPLVTTLEGPILGSELAQAMKDFGISSIDRTLKCKN